MKYLIYTIIFLLSISIIIVGLTFYKSYTKWINEKESIIERLYSLKELITSGYEEEVSIKPNLEIEKPTVIYDRNGKIIGKFSTGKRKIVKLTDISPITVKLLLAMEDRRFYQHHGIDYKALLAAIYYDIKSLSFVRGGSTITQQLAKILFTNSKKTIQRKIYELFCTLEIEKRFTKDEILTLYLNSIYFGHYIYGIRSASLYYFNKEPYFLDFFESALLVAIIPNPSRFSPLLHENRAKKRLKLVVYIAENLGYIHLKGIDTELDKFWENFNKINHYSPLSVWSMEENKAPYFVEYTRKLLAKSLGEKLIKRGGLEIYTTIDLNMQRKAIESLREGLTIQYLKSKNVNPEVNDKPEGAIVAINPKTGEIYVLVGGRGFSYKNQFNRAVNARRQVGSAFKPFVFAAGIEYNGFTPKSRFIDKPLSIKTDREVWKPKNYNNRYYGEVDLEFALKKSLNSVAVQLLEAVGPQKVINIVGNALDLPSDEIDRRFKPYLSLALGVYSFSPLELARAYAIFPGKGEKAFPYSVKKVVNSRGEVILDNEKEIKKLKVKYDLQNKLNVIRISTAVTINNMLKKVLEKGGTAYWAVKTSGLKIKACGKTGTTNRYTDAWFVGYTEDILAVVWVGYDNPEYSLGKGQSGGVVAAPIWANFMKSVFWGE
ncbi:MAG: hypothetical protein DRP84_02250 [Spirochaetes bacterium]|nr:MAG: hypothetical protein DRP84_02250 [Spirochaetota bacterium]